MSRRLNAFPKLFFYFFFSFILSSLPRLLNYQGKIVNSSGVGVNDTLSITFRLYTSGEGGSPIWEETIPDIIVRNGLFSATLGNITPFPDSVDFSTQYWLEVEIEGEVMSPRERLSSAPYAIRAGSAERGYNPVYSASNPTRRRGDFVFRAGEGATMSDDGGTINIVLGTTTSPSLYEVLATGNTALGERIRGVGTPVEPQDAATKAYVDERTESPNWLSLINRDRGAGAGLSFAGDSFSINVDNSTVEIYNDRLRIKANGITSNEIAANAVTSDELASSGVTPGTYYTPNITVDEDGRIVFAENGRSGIQGSGTANRLAKWVGDSTVGNSMIYDDGSRVGIGTTTPQAELDVNGTIKAKGALAGLWAAQPIDNCITLSSTSWTDIPGLSLTINLDRQAVLFFTYSINVQPNGNPGSNWLGTRIVVDGTPYYQSGSHFQPFCSGDCNIDVSGNLVLTLSSGTHTATVQYLVTGFTWSNCVTGWGNYIGGRTFIALGFYQ